MIAADGSSHRGVELALGVIEMLILSLILFLHWFSDCKSSSVLWKHLLTRIVYYRYP